MTRGPEAMIARHSRRLQEKTGKPLEAWIALLGGAR